MTSRFRVPSLGTLDEEIDRGRRLRPITIVADPGDGAEVTSALLAAHAPRAGVVTVHPTPGSVSVSTLIADVMAALGCAVERASPEHVGGNEAGGRAVRSWILADNLAYLIVLRAHLLTSAQLAWLLWLRRATPVHLALIWHSSKQIRWGGVEAAVLPHRLVPVSRLIARLPRPTPNVVQPGRDLAAVPDSDAGKFLADAESRMPGEQFAAVRAEFVTGGDRACAWIGEHTGLECAHRGGAPTPWRGEQDHILAERMLGMIARTQAAKSPVAVLRSRRGTDDLTAWHEIIALYRLLGHVVVDSPGMQTTITRLRGAQTALSEHGIDLPLPPNLAYMVGYAMSSTPLSTALIETIRARVANPVHAAAVVIGLFTGAGYTELNLIPHAGFTGDALIFAPTSINRFADVCVWAVPPIARPVIDAAITFGRSAPDPFARLLTGGVGSTGQILAETIRATTVPAPARHPWNRGWMWQAGMLWLGYQPRPPQIKQPTRRPDTLTFRRRHPNPLGGGGVIEERVPRAERIPPADRGRADARPTEGQ